MVRGCEYKIENVTTKVGGGRKQAKIDISPVSLPVTSFVIAFYLEGSWWKF